MIKPLKKDAPDSSCTGPGPEGVTKRVSVEEIAQHYTDMAVGVLVDIASDSGQSVKARLAAATALLDRGWGKPATKLQGSANDTPKPVPILMVTPIIADEHR